MMLAAIEVIGATVVTTTSSSGENWAASPALLAA
jgi:hypothetical protein